MKSLKLLKKLKLILQEDFFEAHLDSFWGNYQMLNGCKDLPWDKRDTYSYPIQYNSKYIEESQSLSKLLAGDIKIIFESLEKTFLEDTIYLNEKESANLKQILFIELNNQKVNSISSKIPVTYRNLILQEFESSRDKILESLTRYSYTNLSANGFYYKKLSTNKGRKAFKRFYNEIVRQGFIPDTVSLVELEDLFSNKKLQNKILWCGSPEEANQFFKTLKSKNFIEITSLWITVGEHFTIMKKRGGNYDPQNLRGLPQFKGQRYKETRRLINSIIDILNI